MYSTLAKGITSCEDTGEDFWNIGKYFLSKPSTVDEGIVKYPTVIKNLLDVPYELCNDSERDLEDDNNAFVHYLNTFCKDISQETDKEEKVMISLKSVMWVCN